MNHTHWSLGVLIGLPLLLLLILVLAALFIWGLVLIRREGFTDTYGWSFGAFLAAWGGGILVVVTLFTAAIYFPWKAEYHQWRPVNGTVTAVSSRLLGDGNGGMNQRFVVTFANGLTRSCDDTRCSLIKPGDYLSLTCIKSWQFAGTSGYNCNFVSRRGGAA